MKGNPELFYQTVKLRDFCLKNGEKFSNVPLFKSQQPKILQDTSPLSYAGY